VPQPIDLAGVDAKLHKAREHLRTLQSEADAWIAREPYSPWFERNDEGTEHSVRLLIRESTPESFRTAFGDCVHNLRSVLDHFTFAAAFANCDGKLSTDQIKVLQFPICETVEQWVSRVELPNGWLAGTSQGLRDAIAARQPYKRLHAKGEGDPARHPLVILNNLDVADKHRILNEVDVEPRVVHISEIRPSNGSVVETRYAKDVEHFVNGTVLVWARISEPCQHIEVDVSIQPLIVVRYPPDRPVETIGPFNLLDEIEREVRGTVLALTPFV
jgi:hypothetical protein